MGDKNTRVPLRLLNMVTRVYTGAEHSGGGIDGVTNRFASSFYYSYILSELLNNGVTAMLRQCLQGGDYELVNKTTFLPNPDYWILW